MKLLYIGDVMGRPGRELVATHLPQLRDRFSPDIVLAQAENVTHGKGMSVAHYHELRGCGIDGFMSGNHIFEAADLIPLLKDPNSPVTRPANYPEGTPGMQYKYLDTACGKLLLVSLMGQIVGKDADKPIDNPLHVIDEILAAHHAEAVATIVNFHGDYSSEKVVIGQYLDGRVAAVIGDHWHVPTADARILPQGTAHMSDVGMVGTLNSSLGVASDVIIKRWRGERQGRNELAHDSPFQFCAALIEINPDTGLSESITPIVDYL
ncbi:MAG: TIGR00282 family metallophosphoesterase [Candidatus Saccharimonadales bacterium]